MILQQPESVGQGHSSSKRSLYNTNPITKVMFSTKHCVSGRSNSQVYFFGKYSNIPGKAIFHDDDHVTFMG